MRKAIFLIASLLLCSCAGSRLTKSAPDSSKVHESSISNDSKRAIFIGSIERNGISEPDLPEKQSLEIKEPLTKKLNESKAFLSVHQKIDSTYRKESDVLVNISVNRKTEWNQDVLFLLRIATLFAIPESWVTDSAYDLKAAYPNGQTKNYNANCSASSYSAWFYQRAISEELKLEIDSCMNSLVNSMLSDYALVVSNQEQSAQQSRNSPPSIAGLEGAKKECTDLGFKEKTPKHGDCVLQLMKK
jgi:hypothetical protein